MLVLLHLQRRHRLPSGSRGLLVLHVRVPSVVSAGITGILLSLRRLLGLRLLRVLRLVMVRP